MQEEPHLVGQTSSTADRRSPTDAHQHAAQLVHGSPVALIFDDASDLTPSRQKEHPEKEGTGKCIVHRQRAKSKGLIDRRRPRANMVTQVARLHRGGKQLANNIVPSHYSEITKKQLPWTVAKSTTRRVPYRHLTHSLTPRAETDIVTPAAAIRRRSLPATAFPQNDRSPNPPPGRVENNLLTPGVNSRVNEK